MIVLDTNVILELMRATPDTAVLRWVQGEDPGDLVTTAVTRAEIAYGIARLPDGHRKDALRAADQLVFDDFGDFVLPFDRSAAERYALVVAGRDRLGGPIDGFDAQIAAIARSRGADLATRNVDDFADTGLHVLNPWTSG